MNNNPMTQERLDAIQERVDDMWETDANFVASYAREDVPALLAEVARLRALTKDMARAWQEGWNTCKRASTLIDWGTDRPIPNPYDQEEEGTNDDEGMQRSGVQEEV